MDRKGFKIAIASGKGGTGKTFVSTNLFNVLMLDSKPITLVDCDAEEPNDREFFSGVQTASIDVTQEVPVVDTTSCSYCGRCAEYCHYNAIFFLKETRVIQVMDDLCHGCGACFVACEDDAITPKKTVLGTVNSFQINENATLIEARMKVGAHSPVPVVKTAIKKAKLTNLVLLDAPPGTSCPFIQTVNLADYVVLVTEPTPFGLSDLKQSVETLKTMGKSYGVIINRAGLGDEGVFNYLEKEKITLLMSIPFDRKIASIYSTGKLLTNEFPEWKAKFRELFNLIKAQLWK